MNYVYRAKDFDFYHTWTYHMLDPDDAQAFLFVYDDTDTFIAIPLLKRAIPETTLFDCSCVYGYSGPISNVCFSEISGEFMANFKRAFMGYLRKEKIVTVFSRLHPFFYQTPLITEFSNVFDNGKVVVIDLKTSIENQRASYNSRMLRKIKQLRKLGYYVKESETSADVENFAAIYNSNMLRLNASLSYFFNVKYFQSLLNSTEFDARLFLVYNKNNYPVSGALIVCTNKIMQAHLLGTRTEYLSDSPAKLLIDEVTVFGRELGMSYYNLGSGLGFKEDSLFRWKRNFSSLTLNYKSWRFVADQVQYDALMCEKNIDRNLDVDFFPLYRLETKNI
ncbi:GNAT family N-acetyltransferase [Pedobacter sp. MC2016-24]|uniref:GNAT family N-acetyltransferase n=1 Tax=Pedobacter sp. MC2016-24 TaxID=2780090 RepID=UPI001D166FAC|nr:GNAT family N-acetyltransferase [Pedobacter sp. MC2016-24]